MFTIYDILQDYSMPYPHPMFSSYPIPREYSPNIGGRSAMKQGIVNCTALISRSDLNCSCLPHLCQFKHPAVNMFYQ